MMNVGIIGAGLIGLKRAEAISRITDFTLYLVADIYIHKSKSLTEKFGGTFTDNWKDIVNSKNIDFIIICTQHDIAVDIALEALRNGKHVLCEKPLGRNSNEASKIIAMAELTERKIMVGFNYRFYPHVKRAKELIINGYIGEPLYLKATLGHAARPDYDKEWRVDPKRGGAGALLDPGVHIIDLARYLMDDELIEGSHQFQNAYWNIVYEDNAFVNAKTSKGKSVILHSSITEWKNIFSIEIVGSDGYIKLKGRGGYYGEPCIFMNKRWAWLERDNNADEIIEKFDNKDDSFYEELKCIFKGDISIIHQNATGYDGFAAAKFIDFLYGK
jgi:predicted dehydrogenase